MRKIALIVASCLAAGVAHAQDDLVGPYFGVSLGYFDYEEIDEENGFFLDDTTTSYRLIGGYHLNENLAIEATLGKTSDLKQSFNLFPPGSGTFDVRADLEVVTIRALGLVPLDQIDLFGGIGYYDATITASANATGIGSLGEFKDDDSGLLILGGVNWYLRKFTIRGEYEWFDTDSDTDASNLSVGILFRF